MISISIKTKVDQQIGKLIHSLVFKKPLSDSVKILKGESEKNFDTQGFTLGVYWKPLAKSTQKQRTRLGFGAYRPILVRTGRLKRGFVTSSTDKKAELFNTAKYAIYHQSTRPRKKIPRRPIMGVTEKSHNAIYLVFANFIAKKINEYL